MANWIFSHCSTPLISDAQRALRTDENLWFGRLRIDREVIESDAFRIEWKRVACVRLQPGRVLLVREQWLPLARVIRLDQVPPHPSVFVAVVRTCARRVEVDDPTAFLT